MALTDTALKAAKPKEKPYKLTDEKGLYIIVSPSGGRWWRLKYRFGGKEKLLALGTYPEVSLKEARNRRDETRKMLANGVDPSAVRKAEKVKEAGTDNFGVIADVWVKDNTAWSEAYREKIITRLEKDVLQWLRDRQVGEITRADVVAVVKRVQDRGALETAHRALQDCRAILQKAVTLGIQIGRAHV